MTDTDTFGVFSSSAGSGETAMILMEATETGNSAVVLASPQIR